MTIDLKMDKKSRKVDKRADSPKDNEKAKGEKNSSFGRRGSVASQDLRQRIEREEDF